ncbi:MAG TPA: hypothetical protein G4O09_08610 [Dehalococcoidia bacterium]|nr:hypothetical protein [Dehalococcoidia bacterium]
MKCQRHPQVETNLRCSKCGTPICPRCLVQTPVGARCPDCARLSRLPVYQVPTTYYLRASVAGLVTAIACGVAWAVIDWVIPFFSFSLLLAPAAGYVIGEVISWSVNRKRGTVLAVVAGIAVVIALLTRLGFFFLFLGFHISLLNIIIDLVATALGIFVAVTRTRK